MKIYIQIFDNFEQNNWVYFLSIAEYTYNNAKNASTGHMFFKLSYKY